MDVEHEGAVYVGCTRNACGFVEPLLLQMAAYGPGPETRCLCVVGR